MGVIFVDLKRAFETIDRRRLLMKLYQYGVRGGVLEWFKSYLSNRTQVNFNDEWSNLIATEYPGGNNFTIFDAKIMREL